jgi:CRISPR-associated protein Cmr6
MLRKSIAQAFPAPEPRSLGTNVGLWIDKMLAAEAPSSQEAGPHLRKIAGAPVPEGYPLAFAARRARIAAAADRGDALLFEARTTSRLVIGLGAKGVLEMGLTLDRTWGTPYLPGSALKGLCAAAAHKLTEGEVWRRFPGWPEAPLADPANATDYQILFGTTANGGAVIFHDAWWDPTGASALPLAMDVMTVHHPDYYQSARPETPPSDFDEPIPVPFLSVSGSFLVALEGPPSWCKVAGQLLRAGLAELGAGAKTSSGYGRINLTPIVSEAERTRADRIDHLTNQLRGYKPQNKDAAVKALVRAVQAGVRSVAIGDALRQVEKAHRAGLLDGARAQLDDEGRTALTAAVGTEAPIAEPAPQAAAATTPAVPAGQEEQRRRRARFAVDPKSPKRFFIHLEGEEKALRGGAVEIDAALLEEMKTGGAWVEVMVYGRTGKVRIERG